MEEVIIQAEENAQTETVVQTEDAVSMETPVQETPAEPERAILRAEGLVKRYGKRTVVNDVNINVRQGEIVGLLGPNGAGKTTSSRFTSVPVPASAIFRRRRACFANSAWRTISWPCWR